VWIAIPLRDVFAVSPMPIPLLPPGTQRTVTYFKRFRMEIDLDYLPAPILAEGYRWVPWDPTLVDLHAEVLFDSFFSCIDAIVFPSLGSGSGCQYLMTEISRKPGFLPEATWLLACADGYCASVQGVRERSGLGAIQNVGVVPNYRGRGLGSALLFQALH